MVRHLEHNKKSQNQVLNMICFVIGSRIIYIIQYSIYLVFNTLLGFGGWLSSSQILA